MLTFCLLGPEVLERPSHHKPFFTQPVPDGNVGHYFASLFFINGMNMEWGGSAFKQKLVAEQNRHLCIKGEPTGTLNIKYRAYKH